MRMLKRPISKNYPRLAPIIRRIKIRKKAFQYIMPAYSLKQSAAFKKHIVYKSQSLLLRKLGSVDPDLQMAKVHNLQLAIPKLNNIVVPPKGVFSLWKSIGEPTYSKGFVDGMLLSDGKVITGVGGGLCQLANMIHWLFLHSDMTVKEHWHHDYDVFPDSGRTIPFGSGAGVLYNYFDLQYVNLTNQTYTLSLHMDNKFLLGAVWSDTVPQVKYSIKEEDHRFFKENEQVYRENKLYKVATDVRTGNTLGKTMVKHNISKVLYPVEVY
jgi:vancomycin resistance protein VanW